jgi:hypothetical protein
LPDIEVMRNINMPNPEEYIDDVSIEIEDG